MLIRLQAYALTVLIFLAVDALWLSIMTEVFYRPALGDLISESPRLIAAGVFYIFYAAGAAELIVVNALRSDALSKEVFFRGALLGALAYGTYEMTNYATIDVWPLSVVLVDVIWGSMLTGSTLWLTYRVLHGNKKVD